MLSLLQRLMLIALLLSACQPSPEPPEDGEETETTQRFARLARVIEEYDSQGLHRTGTEADTESAHWLAEWVRRAGFEPTLEPLDFERIDTVDAFLEVSEPDGQVTRYDGIPLIDSATYTDSEGIRGQLGTLDSRAAVALARLPPTALYLSGFHEARTSEDHRGLVVVTGGADFDLPPDAPPQGSFAEGYALINANRFSDPYGHPVLQLPSEHGPALVAARERAAEARLVVEVEKTPVEILNVTTSVPGTDPSSAPIVVMTPRSGWWQVASERGGGLALWVELLHAFKESPPRRTVHFVASTGHELGHVGLDRYLESHQELIAGAHLWLHLGANFAAAEGASIRLQASSQALLDRAIDALASHSVSPGVLTPVDDRPYGEARNIYDGGGRFLSILGSNGLFHSPADRWPDSVDLETLEGITDAFVDLMLAIADEEDPATS